MRLPQRLEETDFVKDTLRELGYTIKILPKNECIAEGGEFFYLPNENILLSGCSRNNKFAPYYIFTRISSRYCNFSHI